ncbi:MAG TPA: hypothetical protein VF384_11920 [Planctomycetota bacterium]
MPRTSSRAQSPPANPPYLLSGASGFAFLLPFVGIASAAVGALLYVPLAVHFPLAGYFTALFAVGFAFISVYPVALAGRVLRVRSAGTMRLHGVTTGVACLYFAWTFFAWVITQKFAPPPTPSLADWLHSPASVWALAQQIAQTGWFEVRGVQPCGGLLWTLWILEAAIVITGCIYWAPSRTAGRPFCEACRRWMTAEPSMALSTVPIKTSAIREQGLAAIQDVALPHPSATAWLSLRSWRCAKCNAGTLQVARVFGFVKNDLLTPNRAAVPSTSIDPILPMSWQRPDDAAHLARIGEALRTARIE